MNANPKYYRIKVDIQKKIDDGIYQTHQLLPTEKEFMKYYSVSRITIRKALDELERNDYIYKIQGKGTYVGDPSVKGINILRVTSCVSELRKLGYSTERVVLCACIIDCTEELSAKYGLCPGERYFKFERVYTGDGAIYSYEISYYLYQYVIGIENIDLSKKSIHAVLRSLHFYDYSIRRRTEIKAILSDEELGKRFSLPMGFPLLQLYLQSYATNDISFDIDPSVCVEVHKAIWRSDVIPVIVTS